MKNNPIKKPSELVKAKKVLKKRPAKKVLTREEPKPIYFSEVSWSTEKPVFDDINIKIDQRENKTSVKHTAVVIIGVLFFIAGLTLLCINREILRECIAIYNSVQ